MATNPNFSPRPRPQPEPEPDAGHVPFTEEFDNAKHNLPDAAPVIISIVVLALITVIGAYLLRSKPVIQGGIQQVFVVDVPSQSSSLIAVQLKMKNVTDKPISLRDVLVTTRGDWGEHSDNFASAADIPRYVKAFPGLAEHAPNPIARETKIAPGAELAGTVMVAFPLSKQQLDSRKSLDATLSFYNHTPVILK